MSMERELNEVMNKELAPSNLRTAMERAERPLSPPQVPDFKKMVATPQVAPLTRISPQPLIRMSEAMQRVQRLAEDMERAADLAERQLKIIKEIL